MVQSEGSGATPTRPRRRSARRVAREREIRAAAVDLFQDRGYEATTMRDLAQVVGMDAGSLYNHFRSKYDLLREVLIGTMEELVEEVRISVEAAPDSPTAQLRALISSYVRFHSERLHEAGIADSERRSLEADDSRRLLELRRELAGMVREILERGKAGGEFEFEDAGVATLCVLSVPARLPVWFRPEGRLGLDEVVEPLTAFVLRGVGAEPGAA
ncbi:MAG TPA: TetR/AcrR family transcriptional regulator [Solirubrobacterales bacterium]|jgi:AcrR family transcriptional regulator